MAAVGSMTALGSTTALAMAAGNHSRRRMQVRGDPCVDGVRILRDQRSDRAIGRELCVQHDCAGLGLRQVASVTRIREEGQRLRIRALQRRDVRDAEVGIALERTAEADRELTKGSGAHERCPLRAILTACPAAASRASASPASARRRRCLVASLQCRQHLRRDVERLVHVQHALADDQVVVGGARERLHFLQQRALQLADLFVATQVQIFDVLVLLAGQLALPVAQVLLGVAALVLGHHRAVALSASLPWPSDPSAAARSRAAAARTRPTAPASPSWPAAPRRAGAERSPPRSSSAACTTPSGASNARPATIELTILKRAMSK